MPLLASIRASWPGWLALSVLWFLGIALAGTQGNFPLNDDWSYSDTLRRLLQEGHYAPNHWTSMPLLSNLAWGAAFSQMLGFSHDTLRLSTQVGGLIGVVATFELLKRCGASTLVSLLGAASLMFNPLYFMLANTYMTDVLFTGLFTLGLLTGMAQLDKPSPSRWGWFCFFCLAATLSRQLGLALAAGHLLASLSLVRQRRMAWLPSVAVLALCMLALWAHQHHLAAQGLTPAMSTAQGGRLMDVLHHPKWLVANLITQSSATLLYLAILASPIWLMALGKPHGQPQPCIRTRCLLGLLGAIMAALALAIGWRQTGTSMPWLGNILTDHGLGPFTLPDVERLRATLPESPLPRWWQALTAVGMASVVLGAAYLAAQWPVGRVQRWMSAMQPRQWLLLGTALTYLAPLLISGMFDRYLLPLIPIMGALWLTGNSRPWPLRAAALAIGVMTITSVAQVHDHFAWQKARWALIETAKNKHHVTDSDLNGGFEHDAPLFYSHASADNVKNGFQWQARPYKVSFHPLPGHLVIETQAWSAWLGPSQRMLFLLKEAP